MVERGVVKLLDFISEHKGMEKGEFLSTFSYPILVVPGDRETVLPQSKRGQHQLEEVMKTVQTTFDEEEETLPPSFRKILPEKALVFPLQVEGDSSSITVGRSPERELFLDDPEVSSHHATITWRGDPRAYFLTDNNSTNGTYIDGIALVGGREEVVGDQAAVEFGLNRLFVFYYPETMFRCVRLS